MKVRIVGGGIIGLSTAYYIKLHDPESEVSIVTHDITPNTTGNGAAGLWFPFLLGQTPQRDVRQWCEDTIGLVKSLWKSKHAAVAGVYPTGMVVLNLDPDHMSNLNDLVVGLNPLDPNKVAEFGRLQGSHRNGYDLMTFIIEPSKFLPYLKEEFSKLGGKITTGTMVNSLWDVSDGYDVVVNCAGIGARFLVPDHHVFPIRGQIARIKAPWVTQCVLDGSEDGNYIIPNMEFVVLGGTRLAGDWDTGCRKEDEEFILEGTNRLVPTAFVKRSKHLLNWTGLRPGRSEVRVEKETLRNNGKTVEIIHNYGHGGSGFTVFWGCARKVFTLLQEQTQTFVERKSNE